MWKTSEHHNIRYALSGFDIFNKRNIIMKESVNTILFETITLQFCLFDTGCIGTYYKFHESDGRQNFSANFKFDL